MTNNTDTFLRNKVWGFLLEHKISELPVNAFELAEKCKCKTITYEYYSFYVKMSVEYIIQKYGMDGFVFWSEKLGKFVICYNEIMSDGVIRWTIVHEISHIILGHTAKGKPILTRIRKITHPYIESESDGFTRRVLCPLIVLHDCWAIEVEAIMKLCGVSFEAATHRSDYMKILEARRKWRTDPREVEVEKQFLPFILRYLRTDFLVEFAMEITA